MRRTSVSIVVAAVLALVGCAAPPATSTARSGDPSIVSAPTSGPVPSGSSRSFSAVAASDDPAQATSGAGRPIDLPLIDGCSDWPTKPSGTLLPRDAQVVAVTICSAVQRYKAGSGVWRADLITQVSPVGVTAITAALKAPDVPPSDQPCAAIGIVLPSFSLTLADGSQVQPRLPGDGCQVQAAALDALSAATGTETLKYVSLQIPEAAYRTGCDPEASQPAIWLDSGIQPTPAQPRYSVCRYRTSGPADEKAGDLVGVGTAKAAAVQQLLVSTGTTPASGCQPAGTIVSAPPQGWLMVVATPTRPLPTTGEPVEPLDGPHIAVLVELGGCHRLVAPGLSGVHYADPALATALSALTSPVTVPASPTG